MSATTRDTHKESPVTPTTANQASALYEAQSRHFEHWEVIKDVIDQLIDLMLNYRQSGHPGGSRSKVHGLVVTLLSGAMRWDIRRPDKRFGDRFVLVAGHTAPLVYAMLAAFHEALRARHEETGDARYAVHGGRERTLTWEDLLELRRHGGLPGHVEMEGKNLFVKFNTGPSGHGSPPAAGEALALKRAGAGEVKVFAFEGEGGHTTGATHETKNSAYGLGLDNLFYVFDWNDYGIDDNPISSYVHGTPQEWFETYGWHVHATDDGSAWPDVTRAILDMVHGDHPPGRPGMTYLRTRKGREYGVYDNKSHGTPHKMNSEPFWETKRVFAEKYGVTWEGFGEPAPEDPEALRRQAAANMQVAVSVLRENRPVLEYLADRLVELGDSVPQELPGFRLDPARNPLDDPALYDYENYPPEIYANPGDKAPNRKALARWGAWVNAYCQEHHGRPLFLAMAADLADSTNISGFAKAHGDSPGLGWYHWDRNPDGVLLPQGITEFANSGISVGAATVNLHPEPEQGFLGFFTACSTYGSFVYLKYGPMRLFSQLAQDCDLKVGKVLWVAGHSGPETAEDSRTHFGIFSPGVTQLFPDGHVVNLHPWEHNEVAPALGAALRMPQPIIALHLTRPPIPVPDRAALGMPSHFEAAKGAYVLRDFAPGKPRMGTLIVQGTMSTYNTVRALEEIDKAGLNVKIVAAISSQLFAAQPVDYRERVLGEADRIDSTVISNRARRLAVDWMFNPLAAEYAITSDWDDRWRTGGSVDEIIAEAHLSPEWILRGIERFVRDRDERLARIRKALEAAGG
jgi:transketolase